MKKIVLVLSLLLGSMGMSQTSYAQGMVIGDGSSKTRCPSHDFLSEAAKSSSKLADEMARTIGDKSLDLGKMSCLENILDGLNFSTLFNLPSWDDIANKIAKTACQVAEDYIDKQMGSVYDSIDKLNQKVSISSIFGSDVAGIIDNKYSPLAGYDEVMRIKVRRSNGLNFSSTASIMEGRDVLYCAGDKCKTIDEAKRDSYLIRMKKQMKFDKFDN